MDIWLPLLIIILGSFTAYAIIDSLPETESENSSSSSFTDSSCLEMMGEEDWKELGYLKGDFRDELECRERLRSLFDKIEDIPNEKIRQALIDAGMIEN